MTHKPAALSNDLHDLLPFDAPEMFPGSAPLKATDFRRSATLWRLGGGLEHSIERNLGLAASAGDMDQLRSLAAIIVPNDPAFSSALCRVLRSAAYSPQIEEAFNFLLPLCDAAFFKSNVALCAAAELGLVNQVNILALLSITAVYEPRMHRKCPVELAAGNGHHDCVEILLGFLPGQNHSRAIVGAAANGHPKCIETLLPYAGPNPSLSTAISMAIENDHTECVNLLMPSLLLLSAEAISEAADQSRMAGRLFAAKRLALISLSVAESGLLALASSTPSLASKKNARL